MSDQVSNPFIDDEDDGYPTASLPEINFGGLTEALSTGESQSVDLEQFDLELPGLEEEDALDSGTVHSVDLVDPAERRFEEELEQERSAREEASGLLENYESPVTEERSEEALEGPQEALGDEHLVAGDDYEELLQAVAEGASEGQEDADDRYYSQYENEEEEDLLAGFQLDEVLTDAIEAGSSDVHILPNVPIRFRTLGSMNIQPQYKVLNPDMAQRLEQEITSHVLHSLFVEDLQLDTNYRIRKGKYRGRLLRLHIGKTFTQVDFVFRILASRIPTPEELDVPEEILEWTRYPKGLVMMNGPTGTGKSTTLASLIRRMQEERAQKIITIEKPIEYVYSNDDNVRGIVVQREVGRDVRTFAAGLTGAMREDPDIILIGEVRNVVEVDTLLAAAETGHLALSTMHTNSAASTLNRIKSLYKGDDQLRILASLRDLCRGFANQALLLSRDGTRRFAVREVLTFTPEVSKLVGAGDVEGIMQYQEDHAATMEHQLIEAFLQGKCTLDEARSQATYPHLFERLLPDQYKRRG